MYISEWELFFLMLLCVLGGVSYFALFEVAYEHFHKRTLAQNGLECVTEVREVK
jgi:hypothetical protein